MNDTAKKQVVGVRFSAAGKVYSFSAEGHELAIHDLVVVEGDKGPVIGKVIIPPAEKEAKDVATNIRKVLRKACPEDIERYHKNRDEAMRAFCICQGKISAYNLSMKLVDVDILPGDAKAIFYFTAEERVDFRALVKDLATSLHMRIEMRQIGARDAAKSIGGIGPCGLACCCETYLREFKSIAMQMAKNQGLTPNPAKLTGMCGKLKCCLSYENELYCEYRKPLPDIGCEVETPKGKGVVTNLDIPRHLVYVKVEDQSKDIRFRNDEIKFTKRQRTRVKAEEDDAETEKILHNNGN